jgi:meiotically up-regulated gene 157 (Mug157) protein
MEDDEPQPEVAPAVEHDDSTTHDSLDSELAPSAGQDDSTSHDNVGSGDDTDEAAPPKPTVECIGFESLQRQRPGPLSEGRRQFPYVRPPPECRTFRLPALEALIERMRKVIRDPDLFRLFENSYPNTLDTMIKWRGYAIKKDDITGENITTDEELTYVITGDIDAMWLRDSASQIYSYLPLLEPSKEFDSLASVWRGLINAHARYIMISPYCHSFQPPIESGIPPTHNGANSQNHPIPPFNPQLVFDCKWELDSLASFLQVSTAYYRRTGDLDFFGKYSWVDAVQTAVDASAAMRTGTYDKDGRVLNSAYQFTGWTNRGSETLTNDGLGNPVKENGMVRSAFRPSDDACIFQLLTPSNMMWAVYLEQASEIMQGLADKGINKKAANLTVEMRKLAKGIRRGIARDAVVTHRDFGKIFAYEVDGYGSANLMDDANVPSLLAMPLWNYTQPLDAEDSKAEKPKVKSTKNTSRRDSEGEETSPDEKKKDEEKAEDEEIPDHDYAQIYQNTRRFVLSMANPYYAKGPYLSAVGGPHLGPGRGWPMAATVAGLTAYSPLAGFSDDAERDKIVGEQLFAVLNSTSGTGVVHETVDAWNGRWTRSWFGWANGLFGELVLRIAEDEERRGILGSEQGLLGRMWQD